MKLLRTIHLAGHPLRIYASPRTGPDHPWASFDDLMTIADLDEEEWLGKLRQEAADMLYEPIGGPRLVAEIL